MNGPANRGARPGSSGPSAGSKLRRFFRGRTALVGIALLVSVAQGAAVAATNSPIQLTKPVQVTTGDVDPGRTYLVPSMAVDPANPLNIVSTMSDARSRKCGLARSADGGKSWEQLDSTPSPATHPYCFTANFAAPQAHVAFGRNSTLYYALPGWDVQDDGNRFNVSLLLARSTDLGNTWQTTIVRNTRGLEGENQENAGRPITSLVVDPRQGSDDVVYVAWTKTLPNRVAPNAEPVRPMLAVSTDGGRSFAEPTDLTAGVFNSPAVRVEALKTTTTLASVGPTTTTTAPPAGSRAAQPDQAANFGGRDASVTVDRRGTIYAVWRAQSANLTPAIQNALFLSTSTDRGKSFTLSQIGTWTPRARQPILRWSPEGGGTGTLHLVYEGTNRPEVVNDIDIFYQRSTDGGKTWADPKVLNDDDNALMAVQGVPNMSIASSGRIDVAWWDLRNDPGINFGNDVYYASSDDNGATWSKNLRVTDQLIDRRVGVFGNNFDVTAPPALATSDAYVLVGWDDTRNSRRGELGAGTTDLFTAAVQYAPVGGGVSNAVKAVLAGVVGLLLVGLILLAVSMGQKRRTGGPSSRKDTTVTGKEPAPVK